MDGVSTTLTCTEIEDECCWFRGDPLQFPCPDGYDIFTLAVVVHCPWFGTGTHCDYYQMWVSWPPGSLNFVFCMADGDWALDYTYEPPVVLPCACDPLYIKFGPLHLMYNPSMMGPPWECNCCEEFYLIVTE